MTPPTLRAFRLRLWLPLVLVAASTLIFLILLGLEHHNHTQALQRFADQTAHEELLRTQRSLEAVLRRGTAAASTARCPTGAEPRHHARRAGR